MTPPAAHRAAREALIAALDEAADLGADGETLLDIVLAMIETPSEEQLNSGIRAVVDFDGRDVTKIFHPLHTAYTAMIGALKA
jgi:hypothetical protein